MEPDKRMEHFKRNKDGRLRVVLRFVAGLTKLEDISSSKDFIDILLDDYVEEEEGFVTAYYEVSTGQLDTRGNERRAC